MKKYYNSIIVLIVISIIAITIFIITRKPRQEEVNSENRTEKTENLNN